MTNIVEVEIGLSGTKPSGKLDDLINSGVVKSIPKVGELVKGKVLSVNKNEAVIDIDGITTGVVRGWEMIDESGVTNNLKIDDEVAATVLDIENERGMVELSFRAAGHKQAWDELEQLKKDANTISAKPTEANKGGLVVRIGQVIGFLPVSQLNSEHYPRVEGGNKNKILDKLKELVGADLKVKVIDVDESDEKLIVSERVVDEDKQIAALEGIKMDDILDVKVVGVVDFGIFVELPVTSETEKGKEQNIEGLIHISELAWQRVEHPKDLYKPGDSLKAQVIEIKGSKVSLSLKRIQDDPWKLVVEKYKVNQDIEGVVLKVNDFGAFVGLDDEIHGLCHISELALQPGEDAKMSVSEGETYKFRIINMEPEKHRMGLSRRQAGQAIKAESKKEVNVKKEEGEVKVKEEVKQVEETDEEKEKSEE